MPDFVAQLTTDVKQEQRSMTNILCVEQCQQVLSIPLLLSHNELAVMTVSLGLLESLAFLNQSTDATLALVYVPGEPQIAQASNLYIRGPLAQKNHLFFQDLISAFPASYQITKLLAEGIQVHRGDKDFLLNLIPISADSEDGNYVLSAHDITPITAAHRVYQQSVIIAASAIFIVVGWLFYLLTNSFRARLVRLSERLPLLASQEYDKFRSTDQAQTHWFDDELDTLQGSARQLALRLEALDEQVETKTSELQQIAMYDGLTKLPNRNMLSYQLTKSIAELERANGVVAILFFDLDDFKKVNDSYGHGVGDQLLREAAGRLQSLLRKSDIACRFGGDEFVVMLTQMQNLDGAIKVAEKLLATFREPIDVGTIKFYVSTSIGIAITTSSQTNADDFIRYADIAMYQAKEAGGNCYKLYDVEMSRHAMEKVALEAQARDALVDRQFTFALQPQLELSSDKLIGFEALLRWTHPERGPVSPGQFIPVLENTEFMLSLGYWCIENAFDLLLEFRNKGFAELKIAINLAGIQFLDPELIPFLRRKLAQTGLSPELFELELTERTLVSDIDKATHIMQELIEIGFLISIDDFGTGYSSLSYLKRMPAHIIKIDRSFVDGMLTSEADKQIVASTINMVQNLGMKVIAEGIEQHSQFDMLKHFGCDMAQGYLLAKPISQADLFKELDQKLAGGRWLWQQPMNSDAKLISR